MGKRKRILSWLSCYSTSWENRHELQTRTPGYLNALMYCLLQYRASYSSLSRSLEAFSNRGAACKIATFAYYLDIYISTLLVICFLWDKIVSVGAVFCVCVNDYLDYVLYLIFLAILKLWYTFRKYWLEFSHTFLYGCCTFSCCRTHGVTIFSELECLGNDLIQLLTFCGWQWDCDLFKLWIE